jgi:hypothetical protein
MRCENCGGYSPRADSYCRRCGAELRPEGRPSVRNLRLPVKRESTLPTRWQRAAPVLARGLALVALGVAAELALSAVAKGAFSLPSLGRSGRSKALAARGGDPAEGSLAISETVILRRLTFRR